MQIQRGVPNIDELSEAVPVLRSVPGLGIVGYIRYNGQLYSSAYSTVEPIVSNISENISLINDGAVGVYTFEGTVSNSIDDNTSGVEDDLASLASKINEIIRLLRRAHIIGQDGRFGDTLGA
jgi:hypothetical protein